MTQFDPLKQTPNCELDRDNRLNKPEKMRADYEPTAEMEVRHLGEQCATLLAENAKLRAALEEIKAFDRAMASARGKTHAGSRLHRRSS